MEEHWKLQRFREREPVKYQKERLRGSLVRCLWQGERDLLLQRLGMQFTLGSRKLRDNGQVMGSRRSHCEKGEDAKVIGIKRMSQETFEREMVEIRESLSNLMELLQRSKEGQYYGWILRKNKVKWFALQLRYKKEAFI